MCSFCIKSSARVSVFLKFNMRHWLLLFFEVTKMLLLYYDVVGKCFELCDSLKPSTVSYLTMKWILFFYFFLKKLLRDILELLLRYISVAILNYMLPYGSSIPNTT